MTKWMMPRPRHIVQQKAPNVSLFLNSVSAFRNIRHILCIFTSKLKVNNTDKFFGGGWK